MAKQFKKEFNNYGEARNYAWDNGLTIDRVTQTLFGTSLLNKVIKEKSL